MSSSGTIIIIEDDTDDKEIFESILGELDIDNKVEWFEETKSAFNFLKTTKENIFMIFSDINLPGDTGIEFKRDIDADTELRKRGIPFVFLSTQPSQNDINEAYPKMNVQGFFKKANTYNDMKAMLKYIFAYWKFSMHPNLQ
jgi:two-component SAPR family response regulator